MTNTQPEHHTQPDWQHLLTLVEQLLQEPSLPRQVALIKETAHKHLGAEPRLWLSEHIRPLPGEDLDLSAISQLSTGLMKLAAERGKIVEDDKGSRFAAAFPMITGDQCLGVLQLTLSPGQKLTQTQKAFAESLCGYAAIALQSARHASIKTWRSDQLALVRSVSLQIISERELSTLFRKVTELIQSTYHYYFTALYTLDETDRTLVFRTSAGAVLTRAQVNELSIGGGIPLGQGLIGQAALGSDALLADDVRSDRRYRQVSGLPDARSEVCLPIRVGGSVYGVLEVISDRRAAFHENDLLVLRILADNIAVAIEGARLLEDLKRKAAQLSALAEVARGLASILDLDELLLQVTEIIRDRFGFPYVHIFTLNNAARRLEYRAGTGERSTALEKSGISFALDDPCGIIPWVAREKRTFIANDAVREELYRPSELPPDDTRAEMGVPVVFGGELLAVLDIQSDRVNAFSENDRLLFEAFADSMSVAMRNAILYRSERWRRQVAEAFRGVAELFSRGAPLEEIFNEVLQGLGGNLPIDAAAIWVIEENVDQTETMLRLSQTYHLDENTKSLLADVDDVLTSWLYSVMTSADASIHRTEDEIFLQRLGLAGGSCASIALRSEGQPLGVLAIAHRQPGRFGKETLTILETFAGYAAVAVQNSHLVASSLEQTWIATVMLQISESAQQAEDVDWLLQTTARIIPLLVGVRSCAFYLKSNISGVYSLRAFHGFDALDESALSGLPLDPAGLAAFNIMNTQKSSTQLEKACAVGVAAGYTKPQCFLIPLLTRGEVNGAMLVERCDPQERTGLYSETRQMEVLNAVARQTSVAIENIRLREAEQSDAYITAVLLQVAETVVASASLADTLETIASLMPLLVGVEAAVFYQWDAQHGVFQLSSAYAGQWKEAVRDLPVTCEPKAFPLLDVALRVKSSVFTPLTLQSNLAWTAISANAIKADPQAYLESRYDLLVALPLQVRDDLFGFLVVAECQVDSAQREKRMEILQGVAQQVSLAMQNERLQQEMVGRERLNREIQLAQEIQRTFLPKELPVSSGWEIAVRWRPARQVGGDFYSVFDLGGGRWGLVIADVSDKGLPAALYMTVTSTLISSAARDGRSPAETLQRVNSLLLANSQEGLFVTACYVVVDTATGKGEYALAGHNPPLVLDTGTSARILPAAGMPLGVAEPLVLENRMLEMAPGSALLLYTDGVIDTESPAGHAFGEKRLVDALRNQKPGRAEDLLAILEKTLLDFQSAAEQADDVTMLVLRRTK